MAALILHNTAPNSPKFSTLDSALYASHFTHSRCHCKGNYAPIWDSANKGHNACKYLRSARISADTICNRHIISSWCPIHVIQGSMLPFPSLAFEFKHTSRILWKLRSRTLLPAAITWTMNHHHRFKIPPRNMRNMNTVSSDRNVGHVYHIAADCGHTFVFRWISGHCNLYGKKAGQAASTDLNLRRVLSICFAKSYGSAMPKKYARMGCIDLRICRFDPDQL